MFNLRTKMVNHYVDAGSKCRHVRWVNGGEHADTQLVTAQFAITIGIYNAMKAKSLPEDTFHKDALVLSNKNSYHPQRRPSQRAHQRAVARRVAASGP